MNAHWIVLTNIINCLPGAKKAFVENSFGKATFVFNMLLLSDTC